MSGQAGADRFAKDTRVRVIGGDGTGGWRGLTGETANVVEHRNPITYRWPVIVQLEANGLFYNLAPEEVEAVPFEASAPGETGGEGTP